MQREIPAVPTRSENRQARTLRISSAIALGGLLLAWGLGTRRYLMDASFWESEAFIAVNFLDREPHQLFGPLVTPHSFPRAYLFAIACLEKIFGFQTAVLRALPWLSFLAAMALAIRLLYSRFRAAPALLGLGIVLLLAAPVHFAYAAMLKQYTLEMTLALLALSLTDDFFEASLREGRGRAKLLLLPLLCLLSYSYVIALAARIGAWWITGAAAKRMRVDTTAALGLASVWIASMSLLWWTDLRHTAGTTELFRFWQKCTLGPDPVTWPPLVGRLLTGWWTERSPWGAVEPGLGPTADPFILSVIAIGILSLLLRLRPSGIREHNDATRFGSRGLACAGIIAGAILASFAVRFPICPNNLTLFVFPPILMLGLEGVALISAQFGRHRIGHRLVWFFPLVLMLATLPGMWRNASFQWSTVPPADLRPLIPLIDARADQPIVVAACSTAQVKTLPEWLGREDLFYFNEEYLPSRQGHLPEDGDFLLISAGSGLLCPWFAHTLLEFGASLKPIVPAKRLAVLWSVHLPETVPRSWQGPMLRKAQRLRALRDADSAPEKSPP